MTREAGEVNWPNRIVYHGDNLDMLQAMNSASVHLIASDPPFNTGQERQAEGGGFDDQWAGKFAEHGRWLGVIDSLRPDISEFVRGVKEHHSEAMAAYLSFMAARLLEMERVLHPKGSIFIHGDDNVTPYQKVLMDRIFGQDCFRNAVQWRRHKGRSDANGFARVHETILFYRRPGAVWNKEWLPHDPTHIKTFTWDDGDGRGPWRPGDLTASGRSKGPSGAPWRGVDPSGKGKQGRHWSLPMKGGMREFIQEMELIPGWPNAYPTLKDRLDALDEGGLVYWPPRGGTPRLKVYLDSTAGRAVADFVDHIKPASGKESVGHVDQKPVELYRLFVRVASRPDEVVLDPFGGCATTLVAAEREGRKWIVADTEALTVKHARERLAIWYEQCGSKEAQRSPQIQADLASEPIVLRGTKELFRRTDKGLTASEEIERAFVLARKQAMVLTPRQKGALKMKQYAELEGKCRGAMYANGERRECVDGGTFKTIGNFEHDHINPRSRGGGDTEDNLQCVCHLCNREKSDLLAPAQR